MAKTYFFLLLCVFASSLGFPSPKTPFGPWPSLINASPRCPSVPALQDLKANLQKLTKDTFKSYDLGVLNKLGEENLAKNEENIVELTAEEFNSTTDLDDEINEDNSTVINEPQNSNNAELLPTFIPIFRPRYVPKPAEVISANAIAQNPKENKNLIVTVTRNANQKSDLSVAFDTNKSANENVEESPVVFNSIPPNAVPFTEFPTNILPPSNNNQSNDLPVQFLPSNFISANPLPQGISSNTAPQYPTVILLQNGIPLDGKSLKSVHVSPASTSIPLNPMPIHLKPQETISSGPIYSNALGTSSISPSIVPNSVITTAYSACSKPLNSITTVSSNACPNSAINTVAPNKCPVNTVPLNSVLSPSCAINPSNNCPSNAVTSNSIPLSPCPINNIPSKYPLFLNSAIDCNVACKNLVQTPSSEVNQKRNLVLFKPDTVSLMNLEGDVLKKTTLTVLVPTFLSKLDLS